jgi:hypothetical protein
VSVDPGNGDAPATLQAMHGGEPTAYFGERSLLKRAPAVASVRALEDTDLLYLPKETFASLLMHGTEKELLASQVRRHAPQTAHLHYHLHYLPAPPTPVSSSTSSPSSSPGNRPSAAMTRPLAIV